MITLDALDRQEARFAQAFAAADVGLARDLYHPDVVYRSPTVRLFDRPPRIVGVDAALAFIALTIRRCRDIDYRCVERALAADVDGAFVRIRFDWTSERRRLRSDYVVTYAYRDGRIVDQGVYYDPSAPPEVLGS
jgi:ketosteroid isomerase-like protein